MGFAQATAADGRFYIGAVLGEIDNYQHNGRVRFIGSLYMLARPAAQQAGGRLECGQGPPGSTQGGQLEEIGESRARQGADPPRGRESLKILRQRSSIGRNFDDPFSKIDKLSFGNNFLKSRQVQGLANKVRLYMRGVSKSQRTKCIFSI